MRAKAQSYYDKEYFDTNPDKGYPGKYDLACAPWPRLARALILSFGPTLGVTTVTEFGCARGFVMYFLQHAGWKVKGYDFSKYAVKTALPGLDIEVADATKRTEFESADLVLCMDMLEHIAEADLGFVLANIRRAMKMVAVVQIFLPGSNPAGGEDVPDHITVHPREWWMDRFRQSGLRLHHIHPIYAVNLRRLVKAKVWGDMWAGTTFVLERDPDWKDPGSSVELIDERIAANMAKVAKAVSKKVARGEGANETDTPKSVDGIVAKKPRGRKIPDTSGTAKQEVLSPAD